jgi:signal transduction histidine kinase
MLQQEAQRASELENVKSEFLKLASHELRGPVGLIRGYLAMFEDGSIPSVTGRARDVLPVLVGKMNEINSMVDDMLETARLEEGRLELRIERLDLRTLAEQAMRVMRPLASPNHDLVLSTGTTPIEVTVDPGRVSTILTNLVHNAIKYSPRGGTVHFRVGSDDGSAVVSVTDQGMGIAPKHMATLFTRFGRIVTADNSHIAGTGLGLYLARELARRHGGDIEARSRLGRGSTFTLRLPLSG